MTVPANAASIRVGVGIIVRDGCVLVDRRADGPLAGWWEFPGGKVEPGEAPVDCVRRECREELGVEVEPYEPLMVLPHDFPDGRVELHFHLCRIVSGQPRAIEVAEFAWVRPSQTADRKFLPANGPVLAELIRRFG